MDIETRITNIKAQILRGDIHKSKGAEKISKLRREANKVHLEQKAENYKAGGIFTPASLKARGMQMTREGHAVRI